MIEIALNWLIENIPWIAPTIVGIIIAWKMSGWKKDMDDSKKKVDALPCETRRESIFALDKDTSQIKEKVSTLPCGAHMDSISGNRSEIDRHLAESDTLIAEHTRRLDTIEDKLERWDEKMMDIAFGATGTTRKHSPYMLTPFGEYLLHKSFGKTCIDDNLEDYLARIDRQPHSTPYDVERSALGAVMDTFRTDITNSVKNFLYYAPGKIELDGETHELTTTDVQVAMALYLRDKYLERNKEAFPPVSVSSDTPNP